MRKPPKGRRFDLVGDLSGEPAIPLTFVRPTTERCLSPSRATGMRKPPKLYRAQPGDEMTIAFPLMLDSMDALADWMHEAVEKIEAAQPKAQQFTRANGGCPHMYPNGMLCIMDPSAHVHADIPTD